MDNEVKLKISEDKFVTGSPYAHQLYLRIIFEHFPEVRHEDIHAP
nr:hypothetical protein [uncultured Chryseobacterium sp.]